jgi:hypothetical protein
VAVPDAKENAAEMGRMVKELPAGNQAWDQCYNL